MSGAARRHFGKSRHDETESSLTHYSVLGGSKVCTVYGNKIGEQIVLLIIEPSIYGIHGSTTSVTTVVD